MRKFLALILTPLALLAGCGGSGTSHSGPPPPPPPPPTQVIATPGPPNAETLIVDEGPTALTTPAVNTAFITVNVCMPNNGKFDNCQQIDHIEVDTGSIGLRILADATTTAPNAPTFSLMLPAVTDSNNHPLAECLEFADGWSWGSVNTADISLPISGETATNVIVHVIGATSAGNPANASPKCVPPAPLLTENTVSSFGANGILGVGPFINDCNSFGDCPGNGSAIYYSCTAAPSCAKTTVHMADQLPNPAKLFATDNNGVIVELPPVGDTGKVEPLHGTLVFGIGTRNNNGLGGARKLLMCDGSNTSAICMLNGQTLAGTVSASLNGTTYVESYLDSGSNANFFPTSIPKCPVPNDGFLCPASTTSENAMLQGTDGLQLAADFNVAKANSLFSPTPCTPNCLVAFSNLGGPGSGSPNSLDLGLSFFFGRNVFTGIEPGPYFAY